MLDELREHYENLPAKLRAEGIDPRILWLYGFELDFRYRSCKSINPKKSLFVRRGRTDNAQQKHMS